MIIDFRRTTNDAISVNSSRTIRSTNPYITSMKSGTEIQRIGFGQNNDDGIWPRNIERFNLFDGGTLDFSDRSASWHGAEKKWMWKPWRQHHLKKTERENNFEVEKVGCKNSVNLNHVNSNHINTNPNPVNFKHTILNQLIPANSTNFGPIND